MHNSHSGSVVIADEWKKWTNLHVRAVASEISEHAGRRAQAVFGDAAHSGLLLQSAVAAVSRYLMIKGGPFWPGNTRTLLRASFRRALQRSAARLNCREVLGGASDVEEAVLAFGNSGWSMGYFMNPEHVVCLLSDKSRAILALRDVGYDWKEIGRFLGVTGSRARKAFEEELQLAIEIADHPESRQAQLQVAKRSRQEEMRIEPRSERGRSDSSSNPKQRLPEQENV